jgi:prolyl oligopeptidase
LEVPVHLWRKLRTTNVIERCFVEVRRRTRSMVVFTNVSPYHHVRDSTAYPAILFLTGENDHRVNPMESRKVTARLQAANSSHHPILLRTTSNAGHGIGTALDEGIEQISDVLGFLFDQLEIKYAPVAKE